MTQLDTATLDLTDDQRAQWLDAVADQRSIGNRTVLAKLGVVTTKAQIQAYLDQHPDFADDYERARGRAPEQLEAEAYRRGVQGIEDPVFNKDGDLVGIKIVYSDRLLMAMLKARHPAYRDTQRVEHTGALEVTNPDVAAAIDRFTSLAAAAVGAAQRNGTEQPSLAAAAVGPGDPGVRVVEVDSPPEPA